MRTARGSASPPSAGLPSGARSAGLRRAHRDSLAVIVDDWSWQPDGAFVGALGVLAHTTYHLGEIRQALSTLRREPPSSQAWRRGTMVTPELVQALALALPEAEERLDQGLPSFRVRGKLLARLRDGGDVLVVRVARGDQEVLIASQPSVYFVTPHYVGWPYVLVRLAVAEEAAVRGLLSAAWKRCVARRTAARGG